MGMHFMNPVPLMTLVELIKGIATTPETFAVVKGWPRKWAKFRSRPTTTRVYLQPHPDADDQ